MRGKKGFTVAILVFATSISMSMAQPPDSLWSRTYGGGSFDCCESVQSTSDGGYVLAGVTYSCGAGDGDFWLVKTEADGDSLWSRTFGGPEEDWCFCVQQTSDGGYVLAGETWSSDAENYDIWLVRTDMYGTQAWSRTFGGNGRDACFSVQQTSDGGYILAGVTCSFGAGENDFWLLKTDADGHRLWSRTFGGITWDECRSVRQTLDGGYILAGETWSFGAGCYDFWLVKTDVNGDSLWSRTFGGSDWDVCYSVQQTSDGGYILGGFTKSFGANAPECRNFWLVKTDENGDSLWSKAFGGSHEDIGYCVEQATDGGYVVVGSTDSFGAWYPNSWLVRTDADGDSVWSWAFGGHSWDMCGSILQTSDGGFILAGGTESFGSGNSDFWLVKLGPESAAEPLRIAVPAEYTLHQNWPNPFNPMTEIVYDLPKAGDVSLRVFDVLGREMTTLVDGHASAGSHRVMFDGSDLASGVYFYRIQAGDFVAAKKMVLLK